MTKKNYVKGKFVFEDELKSLDKVGINTDPLYPFHIVTGATDTKAFVIDGTTNAFTDLTPSSNMYGMEIVRDRVFSGNIDPDGSSVYYDGLAILNQAKQSGTLTFVSEPPSFGVANGGIKNQINDTLNPSGTTQFGGSQSLSGIHNSISKTNVFQPVDQLNIGSYLNITGLENTINDGVNVGDTKVFISEYALSNTISGTTTVGSTPNLVRSSYGLYSSVSSSVNNPTAAGVTIERTAGFFSTSQIGGTNKGVEARTENQQATNYSFYGYSANGNTNWCFYTALGNNFFGNDNIKTYWGTGVDASIYYDGTDLVVNPRDVGTGSLKVLHDLVAYPNTIGAEKLTNGTFTGNANGWTLATGWAYNTNLVRKNANGTGTLSQPLASMVTPVEAGKRYTLVYTISSRTAGSVTPSCGGWTGTTRSANGTYTEDFVSTTNDILAFTPTNTARFYIDTISLKGYTDGDILAYNNITARGVMSVDGHTWGGSTIGLHLTKEPTSLTYNLLKMDLALDSLGGSGTTTAFSFNPTRAAGQGPTCVGFDVTDANHLGTVNPFYAMRFTLVDTSHSSEGIRMSLSPRVSANPLYGINLFVNDWDAKQGGPLNDPLNNKIGILFANNLAGTDASNKQWSLYNNSTAGCTGSKVFLGGNNTRFYQGSSMQYSQYYSGTNEVFVVTTGDFDFTTGAVKGSGGFKSSDGTAGATGTIDLTSATSITVKDGLITGWA
jgi:hypothetical protein